MDIKMIKKHVREKYNMDLAVFLKNKSEEESLYNYEIARMLDIGDSDVRSLKRTFGIKRGSVFKKQFKVKYGSCAVEKFKTMIEDPDTSLADVGRYFGFSREYARQAYMTLNGKPYTETLERKRTIKKNRKGRDTKKNPVPGVISDIITKLTSIGYKPEFMSPGSSYWISVNNYTILLRSASSPVKTGKQFYFQLSLSKNHIKWEYDFCICILKYEPEDVFYIIPSDELTGYSMSLPASENADGKKYGKYLEAWHLLKPGKSLTGQNPDRKRGHINFRSRLLHPNPVSLEIKALLNSRSIPGKFNDSYMDSGKSI